MKNRLNKTFKFTRNRKLILLNFALLVFLTIMGRIFFDSLFGAFCSAAISSVVLRLLFGHKKLVRFNKKGKAVTTNGKTVSKKQKNLVGYILTSGAIFGYCLGYIVFQDIGFWPPIITLFTFHIVSKLTYFILDLPIGTFQYVHGTTTSQTPYSTSRKFDSVSPSPTGMVTNPIYKNVPGNVHHKNS